MHVNFDNVPQDGWFVKALPDDIGVGVVWSELRGSLPLSLVGMIIGLALLGYGFLQHDFQPSAGFYRPPNQWAMVPFLIGYAIASMSVFAWPRYVPFAIAFGPNGQIVTPTVTYTTLETNSGWIYLTLMIFCVGVAAALVTRTPTGAVLLIHVVNAAAFIFYLGTYVNVGGLAKRERGLVEHDCQWREIIAVDSEPASLWGWSASSETELATPPTDVFMMFESGRRHLMVRTTAGREFATMMVLALKKAHGQVMAGEPAV